MSQTKALAQTIYKNRTGFAQIDPEEVSYWEECEIKPSLLVKYEVDGLADLKELLSHAYSEDTVKRLLVMALNHQGVSEVSYSVEDLQNYTL